MTRLRNASIWLVVACVSVWFFGFNNSNSIVADPELVLPDNPPDVYMTGMNLTRFNGTGQVEMKTEAESLAVYEADGVSLLAKPRVTLVTDSQDSWLITADEAQLFDNEDIEFKNSVVITQLNSTDPMMLTSEFLSVKNQGELVSTDLPVQIVKGSQVTNAIGMEVKLDTIKPIINLLSDVTFEYNPS